MLNIRTLRQPRSVNIRLPPSLSIYLMLLLSAVIIPVGAITALTRNNSPSNPFSDYTDIFPGQARSAVIASQFSCQASDQSEYCTRAPSNGPFSLISITLSHGIVHRINFTARAGGLVLGDLAALWGRPDIQIYRQGASFKWPNVEVTATGWPENGRFNYFIPLQNISLAQIKPS